MTLDPADRDKLESFTQSTSESLRYAAPEMYDDFLRVLAWNAYRLGQKRGAADALEASS